MTLNKDQFQEEQLPMFVSAREVRENYAPGDAPLGKAEPMWKRKLAEAQGRPNEVISPLAAQKWRGSGLYESIRQHGVQAPVWAGVSPSGAKTLWEGHHRIASQYEADPDRLVPILHGAARDFDQGDVDTEPDYNITSSEVNRKIAAIPPRPTTSHMARSLMRRLAEVEHDPNYPPMATSSERNRYYNELGFDNESL